MGFTPHVKFEKEGEKFGVHHRGRSGGTSRDLLLMKFDGDKWNNIDKDTQKEATGANAGKVTDIELEAWGKDKAEFYV